MANLTQNELITRITSANHIVIALTPNALLDQVAASLALVHGLRSLGKQVSLLGQINTEWQLPSQELIMSELKGRNVILSWPDLDDSVSQIMTETQRDRGRFAIIIQTKNGSEPLDTSQISFSYTGVDTDLLILMGSTLDVIKNQELKELALHKNISLRICTTETPNQDPHILDYQAPQSPSVTFVVWQLFKTLDVNPTPLIATLLLTGLETRTERFANPNLSAEVFTMVASCLQAGGTRSPRLFNQVIVPAKDKEVPSTTSLSKPTPKWINPNSKLNIDQTAKLPTKASPDTIREVQ